MPMRGKIWTLPERSKELGLQMFIIRYQTVLRLRMYQHSSLIYWLCSKPFYTTLLILPHLALIREHWPPFPQLAYTVHKITISTCGMMENVSVQEYMPTFELPDCQYTTQLIAFLQAVHQQTLNVDSLPRYLRHHHIFNVFVRQFYCMLLLGLPNSFSKFEYKTQHKTCGPTGNIPSVHLHTLQHFHLSS
jgi:hypothetical protein